MYITSTEYNTLTGRPIAEANTIRLTIGSKLLDNRIGNYPVNSDGYKIRSSDFAIMYRGVWQVLHQSKIDAVKLWVATMISYLADNNNNPPSANNLKLGRFSVGNSQNSNSNTAMPAELNYADGILVSSGIINRKISMTGRRLYNEYDTIY